MIVSEIVNSLRREFPGRKIVCRPHDNPTEIICEVDSADRHLFYSSAIAVIDQSAPHLHRISKEVYEVVEGHLLLFVDSEEIALGGGSTFTVLPGQVHWARGNSTKVRIFSAPGWTAEDHVPVLILSRENWVGEVLRAPISQESKRLLKDMVSAYVYDRTPPSIKVSDFLNLTAEVKMVVFDGKKLAAEPVYDEDGIVYGKDGTISIYLVPPLD